MIIIYFLFAVTFPYRHNNPPNLLLLHPMLYPALIYIAFSYFRNGSSCRTYNQIIRTFCKGRFIMQLLVYISNYIVPFLILSIIVYGLSAKVNVYETFIKGAKSGFFTVVRIMPTLIGLMAAVGILRASGFLDFISGLLENFTGRIGFPGELVPLTIVKMFSSSAATGLLLDIFKQFGTDSRLGMIASISLSCTETIFYTMSVYFMTAGIKKSRYTLAGALIATFAGLAASVLLA